jgi:hypothetical protein
MGVEFYNPQSASLFLCAGWSIRIGTWISCTIITVQLRYSLIINIVLCLWVRDHFWHQLYNVWPLMDAKCKWLCYWWQRSICYTRLFTTPLVVTTIFCYNVVWLSDILSRSGPWISSLFSLLSLCLSWMLTANDLLTVEICPLKYSVCVWNRKHIFSRLYFPLQRFGCLRNA